MADALFIFLERVSPVKHFLRSIILLILCCHLQAKAEYSYLIGAHQDGPQVQDIKGNEKADPISPLIGLGANWALTDSIRFVPRLSYVMVSNNSDDTYGPYKTELITLLYDFQYPFQPMSSWTVRFGMGTVIRRITGKGGTVTIPNGNSTATAHLAEGTSSSATASLDLGFDYKFSSMAVTSGGYGLTGQILYLDPLGVSPYMSLQIAFVGYF